MNIWSQLEKEERDYWLKWEEKKVSEAKGLYSKHNKGKIMNKVSIKKLSIAAKCLLHSTVIAGVIAGSSIFALGAMALSDNNEKIVILGGYPHAVAFCGEEGVGGSKEITTLNGGFFNGYKEEGRIYVREGNTFIVNVGHYQDEELEFLNNLAQSECDKFIK